MRAAIVLALLAAVTAPAIAATTQGGTGVLAYSRDPDGPTGPAEPAVYVARLDGSDERKLTDGFAPNLAAANTYVTFSRHVGGAVQLFWADLAGGTVTPLTTFPDKDAEYGAFRYGAFGSEWSPSYTRVAMRLTEGSTTTLAVVGADGTGYRRYEFGHLFGSPVAWRDDESLAVGTDSGPRLVNVNGDVTPLPGGQQTDTPVVWLDVNTVVVNDTSGFSSLDVRTQQRRTMVAGAQAYGLLADVSVVYATESRLGAFGVSGDRTLAPLPAGAQVRGIVTAADPPLAEIADANGVSSIYVVENGALRKVADGAEASASGTAALDDVRFGGAAATGPPATSHPPATPPLAGSADPAAVAHAQGRSTFTVAVPVAGAVETGGKALLASLLLTALLMILLTFPAELFNKTLEENYDEVRGWFRLKPRAPVTDQPRGRRVAVFVGSTLAAALLYSLLDPEFGFDGPSARLYLGLLLGMVVVTAVFSAAPLAYMRKRYGERGLLRAFPGALAVGAACVLVSRLASFEPGYLYGILGGFAFSRTFSKDEEGRNALVAAGSVLAVSVVAWLLWQPVADAAADGRPGLLLGLGDSTLATVAVGGLQGLVIGLLPLRSLHGYALSRWNRPAWFALYGVVLFLFVHLLLRAGGDQTGPPFVTWLALFAGFGVLSVAFWGYFRFRPSSARTAPQ